MENLPLRLSRGVFCVDEDGKIIFMSEGFEESHFNELVKLIDSKL